ncbi:hypothetical protein [Bacillus sp. FJAT-47783]|uniref:hypothetical protein n=1 Tax=Bacillus sp. FJAT-47783 TaxID=2922712 RepID=UPI001FAC24D2|nr:hypothetical protein [Bacillus sp. FJAT-47783]
MDNQEKKEIKEKATEVAVDYFKKEKDLEIKVYDVELQSTLGAGAIIVYAEVIGEDKEVYATIRYDDYEVLSNGELEVDAK